MIGKINIQYAIQLMYFWMDLFIDLDLNIHNALVLFQIWIYDLSCWINNTKVIEFMLINEIEMIN